MQRIYSQRDLFLKKKQVSTDTSVLEIKGFGSDTCEIGFWQKVFFGASDNFRPIRILIFVFISKKHSED